MDYKSMTKKKVEEYIKTLDRLERFNAYPELLLDERKSVQAIGIKIEKEKARFLKEQERLAMMNKFENQSYREGYKYIAGIDEVGRGPLAGPVVSAAVILPKNCVIEGINDSKKLSEKKREELYVEIKEKAIAIGVGIIDNETIDGINILNATKESMKDAVYSLSVDPDILLIDALRLADIDIRQLNIVGGDSKSISIAAASIIAKVTRDRMLVEYSNEYPGYGFEKHKGYGTKEHYDAIEKLGITPIHRLSFLKSVLNQGYSGVGHNIG